MLAQMLDQLGLSCDLHIAKTACENAWWFDHILTLTLTLTLTLALALALALALGLTLTLGMAVDFDHVTYGAKLDDGARSRRLTDANYWAGLFSFCPDRRQGQAW